MIQRKKKRRPPKKRHQVRYCKVCREPASVRWRESMYCQACYDIYSDDDDGLTSKDLMKEGAADQRMQDILPKIRARRVVPEPKTHIPHQAEVPGAGRRRNGRTFLQG